MDVLFVFRIGNKIFLEVIFLGIKIGFREDFVWIGKLFLFIGY